jgi:hypothetical protein
MIIRPIKSEESLKGRLEYMFKPIDLLEAYQSGWLQVAEPERELACQLNSNLREFVDGLHEVGKDRRRIRGKGNLHLRQMLDFWLGEEFVEAHKQDNQLDFDLLNGRKADLVVKHIVNKEYLKPYVQLESVYPANSITLHSREGI